MPNATVTITPVTPRCACGNICGCERMRLAGWTVQCFACGCGLRRPLADVLSEAEDTLPEWIVESEDRIRHRGDRIRMTFGTQSDGHPDEPEDDWSSVEPDDYERDDRLSDEAYEHVLIA